MPVTPTKVPLFSHGVTLQKVSDTRPLFMGLLWGQSGFGKTTLACTLPGKKLLINFDPGGPGSVAHRPDIDLLDFSAAPMGVINEFKSSENPLNLRPIIQDYDAVILDSVTTLVDRATEYGISITTGATIERASPGAYGARNALTLMAINTMLRLCTQYKKHLVMISHDTPIMRKLKNASGVVVGEEFDHYSLMLGGKLPNQTGLRFSEVWPCYPLGTDGTKTIGIKNGVRLYKPAKSRMFDSRTASEFTWKFDPVKWEGHTIAEWHEKWLESGMMKLPVPK